MVFSGPNVCVYIFIQTFCLTLYLSSLVIDTHLLLTNDAIYAVGAAKSAASYTPFSPLLPSSIANPLFKFMVLNRNDTDSTYAIWL